MKQFNANTARLKRHRRMRNHLAGSTSRPRLSVFRSGQHIYAQIIDDTTGFTLVAASSLDASLKDFKPATPLSEKGGDALKSAAEAPVSVAEAAASVLAGKGKSAKTEKPAPKPQGKAAQPQKGGPAGKVAQPKTLLPAAVKGARKTPVEALAPIASNHKVAIAHEVGKLVAQRAKDHGIKQIVFDRGGYTYHGRVAALAEGARAGGLDF